MREWLKTSRLQKNLTMKQIADELGISESYYCSIENGDRQKNMDITLIAALSRILKIPISKIVKYETSD